VCHADPSGDWGSVILAMKADIHARSSSGERVIHGADFLKGPFETALKPDEVVTEVRIPVGKGRGGGAYLKLERKVGDFATVGVAHRADQSPAVADQRIGDPVRRLGKERRGSRQLLAALDVGVSREGADDNVTVVAFDGVQAADPGDVHEHLRPGEAELEQRDEALTTGHDLGRVATFFEDGQRLVEGRWSAIVEGGGKHVPPP